LNLRVDNFNYFCKKSEFGFYKKFVASSNKQEQAGNLLEGE